MLVFSYMYIRPLVLFVFCIITYKGDSILKYIAGRKECEKYHNMASFPAWFQIQYGTMLLFLNRFQIFCEQSNFTLFKQTNLNTDVYHFKKKYCSIHLMIEHITERYHNLHKQLETWQFKYNAKINVTMHLGSKHIIADYTMNGTQKR